MYLAKYNNLKYDLLGMKLSTYFAILKTKESGKKNGREGGKLSIPSFPIVGSFVTIRILS
ncbi:hypothetical protein CR513_23813, partial [Mucuna pruriens]